MSDSVITIVAIFLAAILMFIFPLMTVADRNDDIAQQEVQTATAEFVNNIRFTGKITKDAYDAYVLKISSTGNSFTVEMEAQILDENPAKKVTQVETTKIGENVYYSIYTSQIESELEDDYVKELKEGDIITVRVKNTNTTIAQILKNFWYSITGNDTYQIAASSSGVVMANGEK